MKTFHIFIENIHEEKQGCIYIFNLFMNKIHLPKENIFVQNINILSI